MNTINTHKRMREEYEEETKQVFKRAKTEMDQIMNNIFASHKAFTNDEIARLEEQILEDGLMYVNEIEAKEKENEILKLTVAWLEDMVAQQNHEITTLKKKPLFSRPIQKKRRHRPFTTCGDNGGVTQDGYSCRQIRYLDGNGRCHHHPEFHFYY